MKALTWTKLWLILAAVLFTDSPRAADPVAAETQTAPVVLVINGAVERPLRLTEADLAAFPRSKVIARDHDGEESEFEGVALAELLRRAGVPLREKLRGPALAMCLLVKAADGYAAAFSLAEVDPDFNSRRIILANRRDGGSLLVSQGPWRLIVPGELRQARWVRQVTELTVIKLPVGAGPAPTPK